nr:DNA replication protein [Exophiala xenobiotica]
MCRDWDTWMVMLVERQVRLPRRAERKLTARQVKAGTTIELPKWLGVMLAVSTGNTPGSPQLVTLNFPPPLQQRVINALKANPRTVDLRAQAPHYYALGARIMELFEDQAVLDTLLDTFKSRASEIADQAHNPRGALGDGADFLRGLEESERQLFKAAHEGPKAVKAWTQDLRKST